jgi:hypothetical protein
MLRRLIAVSTLCVLAAAPLEAQGLVEVHRNAREGFWIGFGLGGGSIGADCSSCSSDRTGGFSGYLRLGGTVSSHVLLGGEANGWARSENGVDETMGFGSFIATIYPSAAGAFFLKFGIGGMTYTAGQSPFKITATAPAGSFGVGYDIRVGRMLSVTPFFNALASSAVRFDLNGVSVPTGQDLKLNLVQLGVGLTWH